MLLIMSCSVPPVAAVFTAEAPAETIASVTALLVTNLLTSFATSTEPVLTAALTREFFSASSKEFPCATLAVVFATTLPIMFAATCDVTMPLAIRDSAIALPTPGRRKDKAAVFARENRSTPKFVY